MLVQGAVGVAFGESVKKCFAGGHEVKHGDLHAALGSGGKYMGRYAHSILKVHVDPPVLLALVLDLADTDPANFSN